MAVPAHDTRDYEFAKKFNLPIKQVITNKENSASINEKAYIDTENGILINSDFINGMEVTEAISAVIKKLELDGIGKSKINYKLRDWVFSRQRYWGEPIPMVYCEKCGWVPLDEKDLPLVLPDVKEFLPGEDGESPLAKQTDWINVKCPHCGRKSKTRNRHHASMGRLFLVFLTLHGSK